MASAAPLKDAQQLAQRAKTPFPGASPEYEAARRALLAEEIELRRHSTRVAEQRRALPPGPVIEKAYQFKDEHGFDARLIDLFGDKDTLVTYFWMYGPQRQRPCPMCTNLIGALNGNARDIRQRVAFKVLGRSPVGRQYEFAHERGWRDIQFVQTVGADYAEPRTDGLSQGRRSRAPLLGQRDEQGHGRPRPRSARFARPRAAVVGARPDARGARRELVPPAAVLTGGEQPLPVLNGRRRLSCPSSRRARCPSRP